MKGLVSKETGAVGEEVKHENLVSNALMGVKLPPRMTKG